jgi:hypothetical protein
MSFTLDMMMLLLLCVLCLLYLLCFFLFCSVLFVLFCYVLLFATKLKLKGFQMIVCTRTCTVCMHLHQINVWYCYATVWADNRILLWIRCIHGLHIAYIYYTLRLIHVWWIHAPHTTVMTYSRYTVPIHAHWSAVLWVYHLKSKIAKPANAFLDCHYGTSIGRLSLRYIVPLPVELYPGSSSKYRTFSEYDLYDLPPWHHPTADQCAHYCMDVALHVKSDPMAELYICIALYRVGN